LGLRNRGGDGRLHALSGQLFRSWYRHNDQESARKSQVAADADNGGRIARAIDSRVHRKPATPRKEGGELVGAVADHRHTCCLQPFQGGNWLLHFYLPGKPQEIFLMSLNYPMAGWEF
jgi:hypothetical protein